MPQYDLNFWPETDWERESSIDPRFLLAAFFCLQLLAIFGIYSYYSFRLGALKNELAGIEIADKAIVNNANAVKEKMACLQYWQEIEAKTRHKAESRMPLSAQLEAWALSTPPAVVLSAIDIRSQMAMVEADTAKAAGKGRGGGKAKVSRLQYAVTFQGVASGDNADDVISRLSRELPRHPGIAPWVDNVQLVSAQPEAVGPGKTPAKRFTLSAVYKPLEWYDEIASASTKTVK